MHDAADGTAGRTFPAPADRTRATTVGTRLLVLDVDGTVCDSRHEVSAAACAGVARVRAAGIEVILATGRRYRDTLPVAARLGVAGPLVTASGALVKRPGDHATLLRAAFEPEVLAGVLALIVERGHEPVVYTDSYAEGFDFHCRGLPDPSSAGGGVAQYLDYNRALACVRPDLDRAPPAGVFAGFAMGSREAMLDLQTALHGTWPGRLSTHVIRSPRYRDWLCEIAPAGITKWSGILAVAEGLGIGPGSICAVGDDVNDLPMIRAAGLGIAMGNGTPEVREAADRVVAAHDDGGVAEVADILLAGLAQTAPPRAPRTR
ncbi:MAG: haloacid dehalogenase [Planctomycetia bacterium]|nr:haloacid dehalogenase [Planctomycetia bacterium]